MKKLALILLSVIAVNVYAQTLTKEFVIKNYFDKVEKISDNHYSIELNLYQIKFDLIGDSFALKSYVNPHVTKTSTRPLDYDQGFVTRSAIVDEQVRVKDSTYIHSLIAKKVDEFIAYQSISYNSQDFLLSKQNEIIESINHTKTNLSKSANLQIAGLLTTLGGMIIMGAILSNPNTDNIGAYVAGGIGAGVGSGLNIAAIGAKKKAGQKIIKPINF
jgi:hypothetical protein